MLTDRRGFLMALRVRSSCLVLFVIFTYFFGGCDEDEKTDCTGGLVNCGGKCVDVAWDLSNCGFCGTDCEGDELCIQGRCRSDITCEDEGFTTCEVWGSETCVDIGDDDAHCGACNNACASNQYCYHGMCRTIWCATDEECDDENRCTDESCDLELGCVYVNNYEFCEDGDLCTWGDQCIDGVCQTGSWADCIDYDVCTIDRCDPEIGCVHEPLSGIYCEDGDACTVGDACVDGDCISGSQRTCDDGNLCTVDHCDNKIGCVHVYSSLEGRESDSCIDGEDNDCDGLTDQDDPSCMMAPDVCSAGQWCWEHPLPQGNDLYGVWGSSTNDFWAVGGAGTVIHWDGNKWTGGQTAEMDEINDIWGATSDDVWIAGNDNRDSQCSTRHWDGSEWRTVLGPSSTGKYSIWGTASDDVWAVGQLGSTMHWDGMRWSFERCEECSTLRCVWGDSPNMLWAGGDSAEMFRWDGISWSEVNLTVERNRIEDIWGTEVVNAWALVRNWNFKDNTTSMLHFDGSSWTNLEVADAGLYALWGNASNDIWAVGDKFYHYDGNNWSSHGFEEGQLLRGVWGVGPDDIWSVGEGGHMHHYNGSSWSRVSEQITTKSLRAVWAFSANNVWAGGWWNGGDVIHRNENGWSMIGSDIMHYIYGIWGNGPDDVWVVGQKDSQVLHWNGSNLLPVETNIVDSYRDVFGFGPNDVWIVGRSNILHYDGESWSKEQGGAYAGYSCIWGCAPDDIWVSGSGRTLHWDGIEWTRSGYGPFRGIWGSSCDDVWGVGQRDVRCWDHYGFCETESVIWHWDGVNWERYHFVGQEYSGLYDVWGSSANDVWAVGFRDGTGKGLLVHWDGEGWSEVDVGTMHPLYSIHGTPDGQIWVVGDNGTILRYPP